jgi:hypothetical protein
MSDKPIIATRLIQNVPVFLQFSFFQDFVTGFEFVTCYLATLPSWLTVPFCTKIYSFRVTSRTDSESLTRPI